ncbi:serine protease [Corallococcus sp. CA053C]|uniref:serine protease n=1 Tax=Corallococcus sp. CA053C TaxID=2316732 RepID=UPI001F43603C|nr:serine protease [Corallococcus sp. CA053C]
MSGVVVAVSLLGCGGSELERAEVDATGRMDQAIVGGNEARPGSHPWIISLQQYGSHFCGGSLIRVGNRAESDIVLTAAHCIYDGTSRLTAVAGAHDLASPSSTQQVVSATKTVYHPAYNPDTTVNDIAVVVLAKPIKFSATVQPVCLPWDTVSAGSPSCGQSSSMRPTLVSQPSLAEPPRNPVGLVPGEASVPAENTMMIAAGWGLTSEGGAAYSNVLLQVGVPIVGSAALARQYSSQGITIFPEAMLGAGYAQGGKDSCQGDSGGPLVAKALPGYTLYGITSFGIGCARAGSPGVYTRVSNYRSWINAQIANNSRVQ